MNIGLREIKRNHAIRTRWNGQLSRQLKKILTGGFKSRARKKRANVIIAEKKNISLRNADQLTKPLSRKSRERALKKIKERKGISARKKYMNCEMKRKNETRAQGTLPSISTY